MSKIYSKHKRSGGFVTAPAQKVPILGRADVVVAGAGTAGVFAALGAAQLGAKTVLIDQNGQIGGNIGPSLITMGWLAHWSEEGVAKIDFKGGLKGIPLEFFRQVQKENNVTFSSISKVHGKFHNTFTANAASYVLQKMLEKYKVRVLVHASAGDPIMDRKTVKGLFVETKSGRVAIPAKTVVDGTGDAEIAARAGAPVLHGFKPKKSYAPVINPVFLTANYPDNYNETEMKFYIVNINARKLKAFLGVDSFDIGQAPKRLARLLEKAAGTNEYRESVSLSSGENVYYRFRMHLLPGVDRNGILEEFVFLRGDFDPLDAVQMSRYELMMRSHAHESVRFLRKHVPGCEKAFILFSVPYLGARGGPCIAGEHLLTPEEMRRGARFQDVLFENIYEGYLKHGSIAGFDVPYRMLLPKNVEGLLVTGRGCSYVRRGHDPRAIRGRQNMMLLGLCAGYAAALAAKAGVSPKNLDVRRLQQKLRRAGILSAQRKQPGEKK